MAEITHRDREQAEAALPGMNFDIPAGQTIRDDVAQALAQARESAYQMGYAEAAGRPGKVRVLRVIEYVYPDAETMVTDMANWGVQGMGRFGKVALNSTVLAPEVLD